MISLRGVWPNIDKNMPEVPVEKSLAEASGWMAGLFNVPLGQLILNGAQVFYLAFYPWALIWVTLRFESLVSVTLYGIFVAGWIGIKKLL